MNTSWILLIGILLFGVQACTLNHTAEIHVSESGSDTNAGTISNPLATLAAARDQVRELRSQEETGNIEVIVHDGIYYLEETLVFTPEDNAPVGSYTIYKAAPGEKPLISGGVVIDNWYKPETQPAYLPEVAHGKVWVCDLEWLTPEDRFHALFMDDVFLKRSSSDSSTVNNIEPRPERAYQTYLGPMKYRKNFSFERGFRPWPNMGDIELFTQPTRKWLVNYLPLKEVDVKAGRGSFAVPATYSIGEGGAIENAIDYLDTPGEWCLNTLEKKLYYWPENGTPETRIIATFLDELIRIEGISDPSLEGAKEKPVRGIVFEGLVFSHCDRQRWEPDDIGMQHDWNMWDKENGLVRFRSAEDCRITNCEFINSASDGVRLDLYCQRIIVENSLFENLGGSGIVLAGYGPGLKDVNHHNTISGNTITGTGQLFWHSPAVFVSQSGHNIISHNHVYDLGYTGMVFSGVRRRFFARLFEQENPFKQWQIPDETRENIPAIRWDEIELKNGIRDWASYEPYMHTRENRIEYNVIHDCMNILHDGNAIYLSANGKGNRVTHNVIYNHPKGAAIRTDDDSHGNTVYGNLIFGTQSPGGLQIKGYNEVIQNVLVNACMLTGFAGNTCDSVSVLQKNVFYHTRTKPDAGFHYRLDMVKGPFLDYNIYYHTDEGTGKAKLEKHMKYNNPDQDEHSLYADPLFSDMEAGDFSFSKESQALKLGIEPLPADFLEQAGPADDPFMNQFEKYKNELLFPDNLQYANPRYPAN